jgi:hypothetical protein
VSEAFHRHLHQGRHQGFVGDIGPDEDCRIPVRTDVFCHRLAASRDVGDDEGGSPGGEVPGYGFADSRSAAGDHGDSAVKDLILLPALGSIVEWALRSRTGRFLR